MKSILWILNGCGLEGQGITGGPVRFFEISRRFAAYSHVQHLLTTPGGRTMTATMGCRRTMTVVPASLFLKKEPCRPFRFWSYVITSLLWKLWRRRLPKSDIVITVSDYFCDIIPAISLKRRFGAKWIAWIHHCEVDPKTRHGMRVVNELTARMQKWSFGRIARHADEAWISDTIAGDEIERRLLSHGMSAQRIRRMKNGINLGAIRDARGTEEKKVDAVMVGVRPNKGLYDIIPIWECVNKLRPGTSLALMGGMGGEAAVIKEIGEKGLPIRVIRPEGGGFLPADEYYAKMKEAKILFAPSHEEGWGIAVCEAMAAGLPVIAYDLPAYRNIFGGSFVSIPCFDHDAFAAAVAKALDDKAFYLDFQRLGFDCAAKYDWDAIAAADNEAL